MVLAKPIILLVHNSSCKTWVLNALLDQKTKVLADIKCQVPAIIVMSSLHSIRGCIMWVYFGWWWAFKTLSIISSLIMLVWGCFCSDNFVWIGWCGFRLLPSVHAEFIWQAKSEWQCCSSTNQKRWFGWKHGITLLLSWKWSCHISNYLLIFTWCSIGSR